MDFTLKRYRELLADLKKAGYRSVMPEMINEAGQGRVIVLRHDVDRAPVNSIRTARIENEIGFKGIYYFRIVQASFDKDILLQISRLGHEIGYHYEDMTSAGGDPVKAYDMFIKNLQILRKYAPVKHICMHGSPLSRYDNRDLWMHYDFRSLGLIFEPYFDTDLSSTLYLTDTGRRWDGEKFSIRDRSSGIQDYSPKGKRGNKKASVIGGMDMWVSKPADGSSVNPTKESIEFQSMWSFRTTPEIIDAIRHNRLPDRVAFTFHPQRWNDKFPGWFIELFWQKIKNGIKYLMVRIN